MAKGLWLTPFSNLHRVLLLEVRKKRPFLDKHKNVTSPPPVCFVRLLAWLPRHCRKFQGVSACMLAPVFAPYFFRASPNMRVFSMQIMSPTGCEKWIKNLGIAGPNLQQHEIYYYFRFWEIICYFLTFTKYMFTQLNCST